MQKWRRVLRVFFRIVIPAAIVIAVGWQFALVLSRPELRDVSFRCRVEWLLPAMLLYLGAHTIWASFGITLLRHQGVQAPYPLAIRAYFISQYGKYIPGKVWVILIRVVMLGRTPKDKAVVGFCATYETLVAMAAGAILGAVLLPLLDINLGIKGQSEVLVAIAAVPLGIALLHRMVVRIARRKLGADAHVPDMKLLVLIRGLVQATLGWFLLGLSVWMVMQAVRPEIAPFRGIDLIRVTAINCLSYVLGFAVPVAPAGVGVREYVLDVLLAHELVEGLSPPVAEGLAVVVALVVRLIWTAAEIIAGLLLYKLVPASERPVLIPALKELPE